MVASAFDEAEARGTHDPTGNDIENLTPPPARPSTPTPGKEVTPALLTLTQVLRDLERKILGSDGGSALSDDDDDTVLAPYIPQARKSMRPSGGSGSGAEPYARRASASRVPRREARVPDYVPGMHRPITQRQSQQQQSASEEPAAANAAPTAEELGKVHRLLNAREAQRPNVLAEEMARREVEEKPRQVAREEGVKRKAAEERAAAKVAAAGKAEEGADVSQMIPEQQIDGLSPMFPYSQFYYDPEWKNTLAINGMSTKRSGHVKLRVSFPTYTGTGKAPSSILNVPKASPEHLKPSPAASAALVPPSPVRTTASTPKPTNTTSPHASGTGVAKLATAKEGPSPKAEYKTVGEFTAAPAPSPTEPVQYKTYYPPLLQRQPLQTVHDLTGENHTLRLLGLDGCSPCSLRGIEAAEAGTKLHSVRPCSASKNING